MERKSQDSISQAQVGNFGEMPLSKGAQSFAFAKGTSRERDFKTSFVPRPWANLDSS